MKKAKPCAQCGTPFFAHSNRHLYCKGCGEERARQDSHNYRRRKREGRICTHCSTPFNPYYGQQRTCSPECGAEKRLAQRRVWRAEWSDERRARELDYQHSWKAGLSPEKRAEYRAIVAAARRLARAAMTPEEREQWLAKRRLSPWEQAKRRAKLPRVKRTPAEQRAIDREKARRERDEARAYRQIMTHLMEGLDDSDLDLNDLRTRLIGKAPGESGVTGAGADPRGSGGS